MTDLPRFSITLTEDLSAAIKGLQAFGPFSGMPYSRIIRKLIERGLDVERGEGMTLKEIRECDKPMLTPAEIAPVLGVNPQSIRAADPYELGFPVTKIGTRTLIPRKPFLAFMEGSG